jgi:Arc/MetJ-type ribon-helix-helix transcriptional regulator
MKTLTVRLPEALVSEIEGESRRRKLSKSDVVRERLTGVVPHADHSAAALDSIADLIGSVEGLPRNLSREKKKHLKSTGYGRNRSR